ncbi:MAG TPA: hypothetical protein VE959_16260 [Bryobacteraceae bacterium]|nr:hypothetical protein [Bryobacteraceae bacterium]
MRAFRFPILLLLALGAAEGLLASPCVPALLSVYDGAGFTCQFSGFTLTNFSYTFVSGTVTIPDSSILVTPVTGPDQLSLAFSSGSWSVSGANSSKYVLAYTWDDFGPIRSLEDILNDPVSSPGLAKITTDICIGAAFAGTVCPTTTTSITVFDDDIAPVLSATALFSPPVSILGLRRTIELDGNTTGSASLNSLTSQVVVPEPATIGSGLLALALGLAKLRLERR